MTPDLPLVFGAELAEARASGAPIVALESTIITHGLPYPHNLDMARRVEAEVREAGATPATIAVLDGAFHVGLSEAALERLAEMTSASDSPLKLSRADLAVAIAAGQSGGTTVAATMIGAHLAGIKVFATGGIGGVHRGAGKSFDISADLLELAQTPVTVVAAGVKAILDIPATLEVLETHGVPVIAYGQDDFPAFWSRSAGLPAPLRMDSPEEIARAAALRAALGLPGGQLVANPIPASAEIPRAEIDPIIEAALARAEADNISGKAVTPFLLSAINTATAGRSVEANVALVLSNARLAATIAIAAR